MLAISKIAHPGIGKFNHLDGDGLRDAAKLHFELGAQTAGIAGCVDVHFSALQPI
jgi:hypothetical protein